MGLLQKGESTEVRIVRLVALAHGWLQMYTPKVPYKSLHSGTGPSGHVVFENALYMSPRVLCLRAAKFLSSQEFCFVFDSLGFAFSQRFSSVKIEFDGM